MSVPENAVQAQGQGSVDSGFLNTPVQTVTNVPALRGFVALNDMQIALLGTNSEGDGGQGNFWFSTASSGTDDNGATCVKPNAAGATGRWLRLPVVIRSLRTM